MLTAGSNQASSFCVSPLPPHLLTSFVPSLFPILSVCLSLSLALCDPQLCPRIRELLESLGAECVKKLIGKSRPGEAGRGLPLQPHWGWYAALCLQHQQVWSGDPAEAEDPSS